ncbi:cytochrome P450 [Candidatus Binatia bacterium]|nr:cytochrome P450 [Candidatus Binatia bacterium]
MSASPLGVLPLADPSFHGGDPFPTYRKLRDEPLLYRCETPGFWAVSRHEDVIAVSRDPATFCSSRGTLLSDLERPIMPRQSILYIDPPEHGKYRKLVQPAFSPGRLRALEGWIRATTTRLLDDFGDASGRGAGAAPAGGVDFVADFAVQLPILVIAEMLGVPGSDLEQFKKWSDAAIEAASEASPESMAQAAELLTYFAGVLAERRVHPGPDILSTLVASEIDGERLDEFDLLMFCMTLLVAGNETTRNLLSQGALALARHPGEMDRLVADPTLVPRAVEEMLRFGSPILAFLRTATRDAEVRGTPVREGDRLLLLYASANRDERVFGDDAESFRIGRDASGHVAFGFGEHFCLGAALARMEARVAFEEIVRRWRRIELAGDPEALPSLLVRGLVHLPLAFVR